MTTPAFLADAKRRELVQALSKDVESNAICKYQFAVTSYYQLELGDLGPKKTDFFIRSHWSYGENNVTASHVQLLPLGPNRTQPIVEHSITSTKLFISSTPRLPSNLSPEIPGPPLLLNALQGRNAHVKKILNLISLTERKDSDSSDLQPSFQCVLKSSNCASCVFSAR